MAAQVASASETIVLWPEGVPRARANAGPEFLEDGRVRNVNSPTLTVYLAPPDRRSGTAAIVCPGGAYGRLSIEHEGAAVAEWLNAIGVSAFVLKYRLVEYGYPAPLQDVLRAVRLLRANAPRWQIDPERIGVLGFSAGGHLASTAGTLFDEPDGRADAEIDGVSVRPDFLVLIYPVIVMDGPYASKSSVANLLGPSPPADQVARLSTNTRVTGGTPPTFLVHGGADESVPPENSVLFYQALRRAGVPAELHLYEKGPHGFGLAPGHGPASDWPMRCAEWLAARGFLSRAAGAPQRAAWARGVEGQRRADLGNGTYLNPVMAGDHPDPSVLKDGDDYYMTHSSFDAYPGLVIWHSRDLVNWEPIGSSLFRNVGSVWAPDLVKHGGRYYIYFPGIGAAYRSNYVIWADSIRGPWSDPIDLKIGRIDPGHVVGPDGRRYLFLSGGFMVPLAADGLSVAGDMKKVYEGWQYPDDWVVETFAQEGPKMLRRGEYYYMVLAEGGTAGPPTGHMVVTARAASLDGPWENSPYNPIVRTRSAGEPWWSKGHATLVEGPAGKWYLVYHAYENGFYTLGRQTLVEPVEWTADGWFRPTGHDVADPIPKPDGPAVPHGLALSDDFSTNKMGVQWSFYNGTEADRERYRYEPGTLVLKARGTTPRDSSPLWFVCGDRAYEVEVEIEIGPGASAGLILFYSSRLYAGLGYSAGNLVMHRYGTERFLPKPAQVGRRLFLRLANDRHIVTIHYSADGRQWEQFGTRMDVSGYHHNVAGGFLSLRPALYAAGEGEVRFRNFTYRALP